MADLLADLDRQYARLSSSDGADFLVEMKRYRELLAAEAADLAAELTREAERTRNAFTSHDDDLVPQIVALRTELSSRAPELAATVVAPPPPGRGFPNMEWVYSLGNFDSVATRGEHARYNPDGFDDSRSGLLLRILGNKLRELQWYEGEGDSIRHSESNLRPDLDDLALDFRNLSDSHRHARSAYEQAIADDAGFALAHVDAILAAANPAPRKLAGQDDWHAYVGEEFRRVTGGLHVVEQALKPPAQRHLNANESATVEIHVERLRPLVERLHEVVRFRLQRLPQPVPGYWPRVSNWVRSAPGQLFVIPLIGQALVQVVQGSDKGFVLLVVLGLVALLGPPALTGPTLPSLGLTWFTFGFVLTETILVLVVAATSGLGAGLLTFGAAGTAFGLGVRAGRAGG